MSIIKLLVYVVISVILVGITYFYLNYKKLITFSNNSNKGEIEAERTVEPFSRNSSIAFIIIAIIIDFFALWSASTFTDNIINVVKVISILTILQTVFITDLKLKIIPNLTIGIGFVIRLVLYIFEYIQRHDEFLMILKSDFIGFAFGFGLLFLVSIIAKMSIGFGDVKLFGLIGFTIGLQGTYLTLFAALVLSLVFGLVQIIQKKKNKKSQIPFAPFIYFGYLIVLFSAMY